ncbi:pyridoxal-dependent decarboxylase [Desulfobacter sp.]|uniref:pyridoxal-dependent decarboxylase n=1 Tax=Desulfobacter sp. TaxID=2294 RepID=UPI003D0C7EAA
MTDISDQNYKLSGEEIPSEKRQSLIQKLYQDLRNKQQKFLGYQANQGVFYKDETADFLNIHVNNIGDPFTSGNFTINSKIMERAVLDYYAKLWHATMRTDKGEQSIESYWGYVLSMGSSEGNIYGLWNARDYLAGRKLKVDNDPEKNKKTSYLSPRTNKENGNENAYTPVAFFSEDAHYSIVKYMRVLGIKTFSEIGYERYKGQNPISNDGDWTRTPEVPSMDHSSGPGCIDIEALEMLVEFFASRGYPILIVCNYGSTFKGAYDDVAAIQERLMPIFNRYGLENREATYDDVDENGKPCIKTDTRNGYWLHVDGALGASYMPFIEKAFDQKKITTKGPVFDFRLPIVNSIVMSGHKWPGAPWPCGIFMTKTKYQLFPPDDPAYIGSPDTTFAGSRNGYSAIIMWDYLARNSYARQIEDAIYCENTAQYAYHQLIKLEQEHYSPGELFIARTPLSLTIRFKQPNPTIIENYSLSCESLYETGVQRHYAHIFIMKSVTKKVIDKLIRDLGNNDAFPDINTANKAEKFFHSSGWK